MESERLGFKAVANWDFHVGGRPKGLVLTSKYPKEHSCRVKVGLVQICVAIVGSKAHALGATDQ